MAFKLVMKAIVMPILGAPAMNQAFHFLSHNPSALPYILYAVTIGGGFGEETLYRGYMFERLGKLLGTGTAARILIIIITSSLFAIAHYHEQGMPGVEQALITGLVFGSIYAARKEVFTLMIAHAAFDLTAVALIYYGLEEKVAHLFLFN